MTEPRKTLKFLKSMLKNLPELPEGYGYEFNAYRPDRRTLFQLYVGKSRSIKLNPKYTFISQDMTLTRFMYGNEMYEVLSALINFDFRMKLVTNGLFTQEEK